MAADGAQPLTFNLIYGWSTPSLQQRHPLPIVTNESLSTSGVAPIKLGTVDGKSVSLYRLGDNHVLYAPNLGAQPMMLRLADADVLERYFGLLHGPISWETHATGT